MVVGCEHSSMAARIYNLVSDKEGKEDCFSFPEKENKCDEGMFNVTIDKAEAERRGRT